MTVCQNTSFHNIIWPISKIRFLSKKQSHRYCINAHTRNQWHSTDKKNYVFASANMLFRKSHDNCSPVGESYGKSYGNRYGKSQCEVFVSICIIKLSCECHSSGSHNRSNSVKLRSQKINSEKWSRYYGYLSNPKEPVGSNLINLTSPQKSFQILRSATKQNSILHSFQFFHPIQDFGLLV